MRSSVEMWSFIHIHIHIQPKTEIEYFQRHHSTLQIYKWEILLKTNTFHNLTCKINIQHLKNLQMNIYNFFYLCVLIYSKISLKRGKMNTLEIFRTVVRNTVYIWSNFTYLHICNGGATLVCHTKNTRIHYSTQSTSRILLQN